MAQIGEETRNFKGMQSRGNAEWLDDLQAGGLKQEEALKDLREGILRVLLNYIARHHVVRPTSSPEEADHLAQDCTQEALLIILKSLDTFRGESRFTTWAYQVAIRVVLGEIRRRRWNEVSLDRSQVGEDLPAWPIEDTKSPDPERALQQVQTWEILKTIIENDLTLRQRSVLVANVFQGMPLDAVAEWLGTNRDNVYKILHDARKKLKRCLVERKLTQHEILEVFAERG
jgi:RNA polymerase sigma-70 factor, ECF subfamily